MRRILRGHNGGFLPATFNSDNSIFCRTFSGSCMYKILLANCDAVVVFPHHLAPSINTAPLLSSFSRKILSTILVLYCFIPYIKNKNRYFGNILIGILAENCSVFWQNVKNFYLFANYQKCLLAS